MSRWRIGENVWKCRFEFILGGGATYLENEYCVNQSVTYQSIATDLFVSDSALDLILNISSACTFYIYLGLYLGSGLWYTDCF